MDTADLENRLRIATEITEEAAKVALHYFRNGVDIETKADQSPVTVADKQTEQVIREGLQKAFPDDAIFGEEFGRSGSGSEMWIVDPIDGTRSFITGLPLFGMLLGFIDEAGPELGIIRMPALGEVYTGIKNHEAACNGQTIQVSECQSLKTARLFINEADKMAKHEAEAFGALTQAGELRRTGADCYPHALVARGSVDAVVDYDLQPYDYLPVSAVVESSGGIMTDWQGNTLTMDSNGRTVTAATQELHAQLLELLNA